MIVTRPALAQSPTGGSVVAGAAGISQLGNITNINQSSNRAIINWQGFSVGAQNTVNFYQPGASSVTLNRVIGNETSVINGAINANGQVFIVNSAGVLFGKGSQINTGGLVASTLDIANSDFMAGNYKFSGNSSASIVNQGRITAHGGGYVALMGKTVSNEGVIAARLGTVAMASGDKITLNFGGDSLVDVTIDKGTLNALVANKRAIIADGGTVIMTAKAADQVLAAQVNNSGIVQARSMAALKGGSTGSSSRGTVKLGKIQLVSDGGNVANTGKLDASAKGYADAGSIKILASGGTANIAGTLKATAVNGNGGQIETSGDHVKVADSVFITTKSTYGKVGNWLIDPDGFTIAATGGDITGTVLGNQLGNNDVTIASTDGHGSDGNINVNDAVSWSSASTLTLNATSSININAVITAPSGRLSLNAQSDMNGGPYDPTINNININAVDALNVASITGYTYGKLNINQSQTWTTPPDMSGLIVVGVNVNAPVTWTSGTLIVANYGDYNINSGGSLNGATLDVSAYNFNINAADSFNVTTVIGTQTLLGVYGDFSINASQHWTTAPDLSALNVAANVNINGALTWSSGTLTLSAGNHPWSGYGDYFSHNVNVNAALTGPSLAFNLPVVPDYPDSGFPPAISGAVNISAANALNVTTISGTATAGFNITAAQTLSTAPTISLTGDINVNAPLTWSSGTLTLGGDNVNVSAVLTGPSLAFNTPNAINISGINALNVTTVGGTVAGGFNITAAQTWSTAPTISLTGDINVNAALAWSSGTLTLYGTNVNVNTPLKGSAGALKLAASDNIELNTALNWSSGTLTLNAGKSIYVNAILTASGSANLAASYGRVLDANGNPTAVAMAGSNADGTPFGLYTLSTDSRGNYAGRIDFSSTGTVVLNGQAYTVINSLAGFHAIGTNLSGNYVLGKDVSGLSLADLSSFGFSSGGQFTGNFNGLGHALTTAAQPSITLPSSIGNLSFTNLALNSAGGIFVNSSVTSGAGILTLNSTALTVAPSAVLSGANIAINAPVSWTSSDALTFNAYDNLFINAAIKASGNNAGLTLNANAGNIYINNAVTLSGTNAALTMNYGGDYSILTKANYSGAVLDKSGKPVAKQDTSGGVYGSITLSDNNATLNMNGQAYTLIHSMADFNKINLAGGVGYFAQAQNLDASGSPYTGAVVTYLDGTFAGLGHAISSLTINTSQQQTGLFGIVGQYQAAAIRDVGLVNVDITSSSGQVGGLAGFVWSQDGALIKNVYVTGSVTGGGSVGGVIGEAFKNTTITDAFFSGSIHSYSGGTGVGGLLGYALGNNIVIRNAHANVYIDIVTPDSLGYKSGIGGLIGAFYSNGEVSGTYATGNIHIVIPNQYTDSVGGLIGAMSNGAYPSHGGSLSNSFASVNIYIKPQYSENSQGVGGLVGTLSGGSSINTVYAKGDITIDVPTGSFGVRSVGGLVGESDPGFPASQNTITNAAAYVNVNAGGSSNFIGGFIGFNDSTAISNSQSYGNVSGPGNAYLGGFAGGNNGSISNSAAFGTASNGNGFAGVNNPDATISNSSYNSGANSTGIGLDYDGNAQTTGLTRFQILQLARQGLIDSAAFWPAAAFFAQQTGQIGNTVTNDTQISAITPPDDSMSKGGAAAAGTPKSNAIDDTVKAIDDNVKADEERTRRERQHAVQNMHRGNGQGTGGGFGATIRSIDVDGQRFNLQNDQKSKSGTPEDKPH